MVQQSLLYAIVSRRYYQLNLNYIASIHRFARSIAQAARAHALRSFVDAVSLVSA